MGGVTGGTGRALVEGVVVGEGVGVAVVADVALMEELHVGVVAVGLEELVGGSPVLELSAGHVEVDHSAVHCSAELCLHGLVDFRTGGEGAGTLNHVGGCGLVDRGYVAGSFLSEDERCAAINLAAPYSALAHVGI